MNRIDTAPITDCTECRHYDRDGNACSHPNAGSSDYLGIRPILKADGKLPDWCPLPPYPEHPEDVLKEPPVTILGET